MLFRRKKTKKAGAERDKTLPPPRHIAIIMDGNGRWAQNRGLPREAGYPAGAETFRRVANRCRDLGVEYLTVYAFSTENWKRPAGEVETIMKLLEKYLAEAIEKMARDRVKLKFFGDTSVFSPKLRRLIRETEDISATFEGIQANICLNYGSRDEILRAAERIRRDPNAPERLTEADFARYLWSDGVPDPDLVIRPGAETRLSNFLLWQAAYAELYFTDTLWPDFGDDELDDAISAFHGRELRYGG